MRFSIESLARKSREQQRKMREEAMKINPIFGRIKHKLGNKFLQTGMTPKFGFDKRIQERDLINI